MRKWPISVSAQQRPGQASAQGPHWSAFFVIPQHWEESVPVGVIPAGEFSGGSKLHEVLRWTGRQAGMHFLLQRGLSCTSKVKRVRVQLDVSCTLADSRRPASAILASSWQ